MPNNLSRGIFRKNEDEQRRQDLTTKLPLEINWATGLMIIGIGSDIVQIPRIEKLIDKYKQRFISRILSKKEIEIYDKSGCKAFVARRFAGKESVSKALGLGIGRPVRFHDITITNNELGKPEVIIESRNNLQTFDNINIHLSLSDDYPIAIAFAIISTRTAV